MSIDDYVSLSLVEAFHLFKDTTMSNIEQFEVKIKSGTMTEDDKYSMLLEQRLVEHMPVLSKFASSCSGKCTPENCSQVLFTYVRNNFHAPVVIESLEYFVEQYKNFNEYKEMANEV